MNKNNFKEIEDLLQKLVTENGLENFLFSKSVNKFMQRESCVENIITDYTLRQVECVVYINQQVKTALEKQNYNDVIELLEVKKLFESNRFNIFNGRYGISLMNFNYFKDYLMFARMVLKDFCGTEVFDKENSIIIHYDPFGFDCEQFISLRAIIESIKLKHNTIEIDKFKFNATDLIRCISRGNILSCSPFIGLRNIESYFAETFSNKLSSIKNNTALPFIFVVVESYLADEKILIDFANSFSEEDLSNYTFQIAFKTNEELREEDVKIMLISTHENTDGIN